MMKEARTYGGGTASLISVIRKNEQHEKELNLSTLLHHIQK